MRGYTVIDIETTGFSFNRGHRIVEIGVVQLSPTGDIEDAWETLVNPQRHMSATEIHGITAADVFGAPTFEEIASKVINSLDDRIFVAHNASFDRSFIQDQLSASGYHIDGTIPSIDTLRLARTYLNLPNAKLQECCDFIGIKNELAHSALSDATATAQLLSHFLNSTPCRTDSYLTNQIEALNVNGSYPRLESAEPILFSRELSAQTRAAASGDGWFSNLVSDRSEPTQSDISMYFQLLDSALLDRHLSNSEQAQLLEFAKSKGLNSSALRELHHSYLNLLVEQAWSDGVITETETELLLGAARLLGVSSEEVEQALTDDTHDRISNRHHSDQTIQTEPSSEFGVLLLQPGDRVTVTGASLYTNDEWSEYFSSKGIEVAGLAKKTKVLIASDPDSQSGKAKKARQYGIPVIAEKIAREVIQFTE